MWTSTEVSTALVRGTQAALRARTRGAGSWTVKAGGAEALGVSGAWP